MSGLEKSVCYRMRDINLCWFEKWNGLLSETLCAKLSFGVLIR